MDANGRLREALLVGGIVSSVLYAAMTALVPLGWEGYSSASQVVSELSAIGAPTRRTCMLLCIPYTLLATGFGWGVWRAAGSSRRLRVVGGALTAYGLLGIVWPFAPMQMRGAPFATTDAMHIALGGVTVALMIVAMGVGAMALGRRFRTYSLASLAVVIVAGILTGMESPALAANEPTPWIGVWERIDIGAFLLWVSVLAVALLRRSGAGAGSWPTPSSDLTSARPA